MSELLPILSGIKLEMQTMNKSLLQMIKTHAQVLSEEWITKKQVLAVLKISPRTLETLKGSGKLPFTKVNGLIYFKTIDIENLLKLNYVSTTSTDNNSIFKSTHHVCASSNRQH